MANDNIQIKIATLDHRDGILYLIENVFCKNSPVLSSLKKPWNSVKKAWEKTVDECLVYPHSHVAVDIQNKVIGFRLSRILNLENYHPKDSIYENLFAGPVRDYIDDLSKDWSKLLIDKNNRLCKIVLQFVALAVDPEFGGKGVAVQMCEANLEMAQKLGCEYCLVVGSNWMAQRVFEKLGFETVNSVKYADILDDNGRQRFEIDDPKQVGAKFQIKELSSK